MDPLNCSAEMPSIKQFDIFGGTRSPSVHEQSHFDIRMSTFKREKENYEKK